MADKKKKSKEKSTWDAFKAGMVNAFKTPASVMAEASATGSKKVNKFREGIGQGKRKKGQ